MKRKENIFQDFMRVVLMVSLCLGMMLLPGERVWAEENYGTQIEGATGSCGATGSVDVAWTVYDSNADGNNKADNGDTLVFSGSGSMADFSYLGSPWNSFSNTLTTVKFEEGSEITYIGKNAFCWCTKINSIKIPDSVTSIGERAFYTCRSLNTIEIPENVTSIGVSAFEDCSGLTSITIPSSVKNIGYYAFSSCSGLTGITIPGGVTNIEEGLFSGCSGLTDITIPSSVTNIEGYAFRDCSGLTSITIPNTVTSIKTDVFKNCSRLTNITIPDSIKSIGANTFMNCTGLKNITLSSTLENIGACAFFGCNNLTSIKIPASVTRIEESAFSGCSGLTSIEIPSGVTDIEKNTFSGCTGLTHIMIPESVTRIYSRAFYNCTGLTSIIIPEKVIYVYYDAFCSCTNLKELYYPSVLDISNLEDIDSDVMQASYKVTEDNSIYVTIENLPANMTDIILPEEISSKQISSIRYGEGIDATNVTIVCTKHFPNKWECDADSHWIGNGQCTLCGQTLEESENEQEAHYFGDGTQPCKCGYPISIEAQPEDIKLAYGYGEGTKLSVLVSSKSETNVEYQWYENNDVIVGATESEYIVPTGKEISDYEYYCKITCGKFIINSDSATVSVEKAQGEINIETGKETVSLNYSQEPVSLEGITKTGEGILTYAVTEGSDVISVSEDGKVSMLKLGKATISVSMAETTHYKEAETKTIVIKVMTDYPTITPDTPRAVENTVKKVSDVSLPTDWQWDTEDTEKTLPEGKDLEVTVNYTGEDKEFYNIISMKVTIQRAACTSSEVLYTGEDEKAPTCTSEGKGHKECIICGDTLEDNITVPVLKHTLTNVSKTEAGCTTEGQKQHWKCLECKKLFSDEQGIKEITEASLIIPATGHTGGAADCTKKAVCTVCQNEYGELDKTKHGETEIKNAKSATCKEAGYTGDTYCKDCEEKISSGEEIAKVTTHTWDSGLVTKEATTTEKGVKTYTCSVCGETKTEDISVIGVTEIPSATEIPSTTPSATEEPSATPTPSVTEEPSVTPTPSVTEEPSVTPTQSVTKEPSATPTPCVTREPSTTPTTKEEPKVAPKKGTILVDEKNQVKYKILVSDTKNGTVEYVKPLNKKAKTVNVPATVKINGITYKVVSIGKNAFKNHKAITKVTIGKNVKTIGANAFYGCKKLKTVSMGKNITTIGDKAFYKCTALTKITIPAKVKKIGKQAFYGCKKLKTITIKTTKLTKKNVGSKAFTGIYKKATIKVPKSKVKTYQKMLKTKGIDNTVKVKK